VFEQRLRPLAPMLMDCRTWLTRRRARPSRRHPPAADEATPRPSHDHASRRRPSV